MRRCDSIQSPKSYTHTDTVLVNFSVFGTVLTLNPLGLSKRGLFFFPRAIFASESESASVDKASL